jgi:hypothetical protein
LTVYFIRSLSVMSVPEEAIALKEKGNAAFKAHDWQGAIEFYTQAIKNYDKEPSFYTNRAQVSSLGHSGRCTRHNIY